MELAKQYAPVTAIACNLLAHRLTRIPDRRRAQSILVTRGDVSTSRSITLKKNSPKLRTAKNTAQLIDFAWKEFVPTCSISTKFDSHLMSLPSGG